VLVYVDDIIVASSFPFATSALVKNVERDFALKDLGDLHYFLGNEVKNTEGGLLLKQERYAIEVLQRVNMMDCKAVMTPLAALEKLSLYDGQSLGPQDSTQYKSIAGGTSVSYLD
jgi:histone deacetylase 1/2